MAFWAARLSAAPRLGRRVGGVRVWKLLDLPKCGLPAAETCAHRCGASCKTLASGDPRHACCLATRATNKLKNTVLNKTN